MEEVTVHCYHPACNAPIIAYKGVMKSLTGDSVFIDPLKCKAWICLSCRKIPARLKEVRKLCLALNTPIKEPRAKRHFTPPPEEVEEELSFDESERGLGLNSDG